MRADLPPPRETPRRNISLASNSRDAWAKAVTSLNACLLQLMVLAPGSYFDYENFQNISVDYAVIGTLMGILFVSTVGFSYTIGLEAPSILEGLKNKQSCCGVGPSLARFAKNMQNFFRQGQSPASFLNHVFELSLQEATRAMGKQGAYHAAVSWLKNASFEEKNLYRSLITGGGGAVAATLTTAVLAYNDNQEGFLKSIRDNPWLLLRRLVADFMVDSLWQVMSDYAIDNHTTVAMRIFAAFLVYFVVCTIPNDLLRKLIGRLGILKPKDWYNFYTESIPQGAADTVLSWSRELMVKNSRPGSIVGNMSTAFILVGAATSVMTACLTQFAKQWKLGGGQRPGETNWQ